MDAVNMVQPEGASFCSLFQEFLLIDIDPTQAAASALKAIAAPPPPPVERSEQLTQSSANTVETGDRGGSLSTVPSHIPSAAPAAADSSARLLLARAMCTAEKYLISAVSSSKEERGEGGNNTIEEEEGMREEEPAEGRRDCVKRSAAEATEGAAVGEDSVSEEGRRMRGRWYAEEMECEGEVLQGEEDDRRRKKREVTQEEEEEEVMVDSSKLTDEQRRQLPSRAAEVTCIGDYFSSFYAINRSFVRHQPAPHPTGVVVGEIYAEDCCIDWDLLEAFYQRLAANSLKEGIYKVVRENISKMLSQIQGKCSKMCYPSQLRFVLILLENPLICDSLDKAFVEDIFSCVTRLSPECRETLVKWYRHVPLKHFRRHLITTQHMLTIHLLNCQCTGGFEGLFLGSVFTSGAVAMLKVLYCANVLRETETFAKGCWTQSSDCLNYVDFYNDAVNSMQKLLAYDFSQWVANESAEAGDYTFGFLANGFIIDAANKANILKRLAGIQQNQQARQAVWNSLPFMLLGIAQTVPAPYLVLNIRRDHIIQDALHQLAGRSNLFHSSTPELAAVTAPSPREAAALAVQTASTAALGSDGNNAAAAVTTDAIPSACTTRSGSISTANADTTVSGTMSAAASSSTAVSSDSIGATTITTASGTAADGPGGAVSPSALDALYAIVGSSPATSHAPHIDAAPDVNEQSSLLPGSANATSTSTATSSSSTSSRGPTIEATPPTTSAATARGGPADGRQSPQGFARFSRSRVRDNGTGGELRKQLKVQFRGEMGVDEGGVTKEFFQLLVQELFNPDYGMFKHYEEQRLVWFHSDSLEHDSQFELIGIVLGLAMYNGVILNVHFPLAIYKKLLDVPVDFADLTEIQPQVAKSMRCLLTMNAQEVEDLSLTFSTSVESFGCFRQVSLDSIRLPDEPVTIDNRQEYVASFLDYFLNSSIAPQFCAFYRGFHRCCQTDGLHLFRPEELRQAVVGSDDDFDFESLQKVARYQDGYTNESATVHLFWDVVHNLSQEQKKNLLMFITGSDRIPIRGLSSMQLTIGRQGPDSDRLPTAHTCFNYLLLPDYQDKEKLGRLLKIALENAQGFGLQ
eukprot:GHVS01079223.1.p1 GENE.GHVS01079223.1~~GHVS01079223.1.p1  ORF type:complete len:1088 (+),score=189.11 GHVS01079223.1:158-3421(+)